MRRLQPFLDFLGSQHPDLLKRLLGLVEERSLPPEQVLESLFHDLEVKPDLRPVHDELREAWRGYLTELIPTAPAPPLSAALPRELREQLAMDLGLPSSPRPVNRPVEPEPPPDLILPSSTPDPIPQRPPDNTSDKSPWWIYVAAVGALVALLTLGINNLKVVVSNSGHGAIHNVTLQAWRPFSVTQDLVIAEIGPGSALESSLRYTDCIGHMGNLSFTDPSGQVYSKYIGESLTVSGLEEIAIQIGDAGAVTVVRRQSHLSWWQCSSLIYLAFFLMLLLQRQDERPSRSRSRARTPRTQPPGRRV